MFRSTLEMIPNGVMLIDVHSHAIRFANQEMHRILNSKDRTLSDLKELVSQFLKNEEISTDTSSANASKESLSEHQIDLWGYVLRKCKNSLPNDGAESIYKRKSTTSKLFIQVKCCLTANAEQLLVMCTDITRLKEVEAQGRRMRASFFSSVAHELRTPLNSIIPIVKMVLQLVENNKGMEKIHKLLYIVKNSSLHLQNVIEDALDISRLENNKFRITRENFDIKAAVQEVCEIMSFQIEQKGLKYMVLIDPQVPFVVCSDCKRLKQVLFNLIGNAVKFTFDGYIKITLTFDPLSHVLTFKIIDTGIGIQESDQQQLFKFFGKLAKTKDINRGGMGLGLTISKMLVQRLGGEISLKSEIGQGSEFTFTIPLPKEYITYQLPYQYQKVIQPDDQNQQYTLDQQEHKRKLKLQLHWDQRHQTYTTEEENIEDTSPLKRNGDRIEFKYQQLINEQIKMIVDKQGANQLQVPESDDSNGQRLSAIQIVTEGAQEPFKILCVDDSTYNLFVIQEILNTIDSDIQIETALNGRLAYEKLIKNYCKPFDMIFMDLNMPILDGFLVGLILKQNIFNRPQNRRERIQHLKI
ncbi:hypothetical protein FGO68_gene12023 [Halteria grandinella]|uniref:histidine kinase n=1 Tax=Halteria grandinella TaxID=5974 RepID=A0A8J8T671_HALGN|nr:hypothetical protein FGO68_gene12023 [Halteria grandinella]